MVPPNTTIELPLLIGLYSANYSSLGFTGYYGIGIISIQLTPSILVNTSLSITSITISMNLTITPLTTIVGNITGKNQLMGFATYIPSSSDFLLNIVNPLIVSIAINGYDVYAYNGSLLTACTLKQPITIYVTSAASGLFLPTYMESFSSSISFYMPLIGWKSTSVASVINCTVNYTFPAAVAQMPYGYVTLNTSVGNITIPLLPS